MFMKEFEVKREPAPSGLILLMMAEGPGGICPTIIWLWSGALTSMRPRMGVDWGHSLGRFPEVSMASSWTCRLETCLTWRSPTPA